MSQTNVYLDIIQSIAKNRIPVDSAIIVGSRAREDAHPRSDYDIIVVIKTALVPIYMKSLTRLSKELSTKHKVEININPLPKFRIKRSKGNLFLWKVKAEGKTLLGHNYLNAINPGSIKDVGEEWIFFLLACQARSLLEIFIEKKFQITINKALRILNEINLARNYFGVNKIKLNDLYDSEKLWFNLRSSILETVYLLINHKLLKLNDDNIDALGLQIMEHAKKYANFNYTITKNLQYILLKFLHEGKLDIEPISKRISMTLVIRVSALLLLASIYQEGLNHYIVNKVSTLLRWDWKTAGKSQNAHNRFKGFCHFVLHNWSYSQTVMGL